jgi:hypothetical protein
MDRRLPPLNAQRSFIRSSAAQPAHMTFSPAKNDQVAHAVAVDVDGIRASDTGKFQSRALFLKFQRATGFYLLR